MWEDVEKLVICIRRRGKQTRRTEKKLSVEAKKNELVSPPSAAPSITFLDLAKVDRLHEPPLSSEISMFGSPSDLYPVLFGHLFLVDSLREHFVPAIETYLFKLGVHLVELLL
jgi:hypothetical protein